MCIVLESLTQNLLPPNMNLFFSLPETLLNEITVIKFNTYIDYQYMGKPIRTLKQLRKIYNKYNIDKT